MNILFLAWSMLLSLGTLSTNQSVNKNQANAVYQTTGINFRKITFAEAKAEAAKTGKLIFIDAYTSWCGPCKMLERNTFTNPELAAKFNATFINMHVEMEHDADAPELYRTYSVTAYPSLLFIDAKGKLVQRVLGYRDASGLLKEIATLLQ